MTLPADDLAFLREIGDRYEVLELLGSGNVGRVYRAVQKDLDRQVALKVLQPTQADGEATDRFLRETKIASAVRHPGLVRVLDSGEIGGRQYLAQELVVGDSLREWIDSGRAAIRVHGFMDRILDALESLHLMGIIHRDLKPENILIEDGLPRADLRTHPPGIRIQSQLVFWPRSI